MKVLQVKVTIAAVMAVTLGSGVERAFAAGTASSTTVSNQASIAFQIGGVSQQPVTSNNYQFVVDTKVDLSVATTDAAAVLVYPNATAQVLKFAVQNTGNAAQDYMLSATAVATGGATKFDSATDAFDASAIAVYVDVNDNGAYDPATDTATHIDALAPDATKTVFIVSTIPGTAINGQYGSYHLLATARVNDGAGTLGGAVSESASDSADPLIVDTVLADGTGSDASNDAARDGKHSSQSDYKAQTASLTIAKSSTVESDPFNGTTNPKRIPGAVIVYTVTIFNGAGGQTASSVTFSDSLNGEIAAGTIAFNTQYDATAGQGIVVAHPDHGSGALTEYTNANDAEDATHGGVKADWNVTATNTVTVSGITLDAGESATVKFKVTIQ